MLKTLGLKEVTQSRENERHLTILGIVIIYGMDKTCRKCYYN